MCLRRYLVAVGGMAFYQQWSEQLDQALSAEDKALLEQKGVLEPAIPQLSSIRRETDAVVSGGGKIIRRVEGFLIECTVLFVKICLNYTSLKQRVH